MPSDASRAWNSDARSQRPREWQPPKLTTQQRGEIAGRLADGETPADLALEYGVSASRIRELR